MSLTQAQRIKIWRDRKRALELCQSCGRNTVFKRVRPGRTEVYSKCKPCLLRGAWYQAEYRERKLNATKRNL